MDNVLIEIIGYNKEKFEILNRLQDIDLECGTDNAKYKELADVYECIDYLINSKLSELSDEEKIKIYDKNSNYTKEDLFRIFNIEENSYESYNIEKIYTKSLSDVFNSIEPDLMFDKIIKDIQLKNKLIDNELIVLSNNSEKSKKGKEILINTKYSLIFESAKVERLLIDSGFKDINYESKNDKSKELQYFSTINTKLR